MSRHQPRDRKKVEASPWLNGDAEALYNHYYSRLAGVAITRYNWEGMPDNCPPAMLEAQLVLKGGLAAFVHVRGTDPLALGRGEAERGRFAVTKAMNGGNGGNENGEAGGMYDDLWNNSSYRTIGPRAGGIQFSTNGPLDEWRGVPIWGDSLRMNYDGATIHTFASRLARASLVVDVNLAATTRGVVALVPKQDDLLSTQLLVDDMLSGLTTFTTNPDALDNVKVVDFGVHPDTVERSHAVAMRLWNEALTALGVQAGIAEKTERHTDDEVQAIEGAVAAVRKRTLIPRQLAAQQINRRYFEGEQLIKVVDQW